MKLFELQASQIDKELEDIAKKSGDNTGPGEKTVGDLEPDKDGKDLDDPKMDPMGMDGGMGGMGGMGGGGMMGGGDMGGGPGTDPVQDPDKGAAQQEWDKTLKTKIDDYLITTMQSDQYVKDWNHKPGSKTNPMAIFAMDNSELSQTRNLTRNMIANLNMKDPLSSSGEDQLGTYDDPQMKFLTQLYTFVEKVIRLKNEQAAASKPKEQRLAHPKPGKAWNPKTKHGEVKRRNG